MKIRLRALLLGSVAAGALATGPAGSQTLRLVAEGADPGPLNVRVGDVLTVHVEADLANVPVAGIAAYITVPDGVFAIVDQGLPGQTGVQPFRFGPLFERAHVPVNVLEEDVVAAVFPGQQLDLAAVFGLGSAQAARGSGIVAIFQLAALVPTADAVITIDDNPVRETKLLMASDGTERHFQSLENLTVTIAEGGPGTETAGAGWATVKLSWARP